MEQFSSCRRPVVNRLSRGNGYAFNDPLNSNSNTYNQRVALYIFVMQALVVNQAATHPVNPNKALSAGFFLTLGLTLWTTILISYRIYSTSNNIIQKHSRTRFNNVLEMLIQSSAMYSLVLLANALSAAIPENSSNIWAIGVMGDFLGVILHAITVCFYIDLPGLVVTGAYLGDCTYTHGLQSCPCILF